MLAIYAFLTSGLIFYGYLRRNRYLDVLLAGIGVSVVGTSLLLSAFGVSLVVSRALFTLGTGMAIAVAVLLGIRLLSGAYRSARDGIEDKEPGTTGENKTDGKHKPPSDRDKAA